MAKGHGFRFEIKGCIRYLGLKIIWNSSAFNESVYILATRWRGDMVSGER